MIDDATLLRHYVEARSEEAFTQLVERHLSLVYHSALRQSGGDSHLAQDVAQTVFVLLAEKARSLLGHPSLVGWLHATTHFKVAKALESERRRRIREQAAYAMQEVLANSPTQTDWDRIHPVLDETILELDEQDRTAVLLRFFEGQAFADIGARLLLTEKGAHKRVERALDKVRKQLTEQGYLPATHEHPPSLVLLMEWGYVEPAIDMKSVGFGDAYYYLDRGIPRPVAIPLMDLANADQMLELTGGSKSVETHGQWGYETDRGPALNESVTAAEVPRYYIEVIAADYSDLMKRHKYIQLWIARMSVPYWGCYLDEALPVLLKTGAPTFGRDMSAPEMIKTLIVPAGHVIVGKPVLISNTPASAAP
jgi:RNA polymerase sigma factor (sigma-70 family)